MNFGYLVISKMLSHHKLYSEQEYNSRIFRFSIFYFVLQNFYRKRSAIFHFRGPIQNHINKYFHNPLSK